MGRGGRGRERERERRWPEGPTPIDTGWARVVSPPADPDAVILEINGVPSSSLDLGDPTWLEFEYLQWMALAIAEHIPTDRRLRALHLGGGACALPRALDARYRDARQLAVEIDAALAALVREWFDLPRAPRLRLRAGDGLEVLAGRPDGAHDVIVRDVFAGDRTPAAFRTAGFYRQCARVSAPGGLVLANCADRADLAATREEVGAARAAFPFVAVIADPGHLRGRRHGNAVLLAAGPQGAATAAGLERRLRTLPAPARILAGPEAERWAGRGG
jgi:hypothetical protein